VLLLGFTAVLMLMVAVVVNVSSVVLAKRGLASAADGAASAAAQEIDLAVVYENGLHGCIPLDPARVSGVVEDHERGAAASQPGLELTGRVEDGVTAVVSAQRVVDVPFGEVLGFRPVTVQAEARAQSPTGGECR
jgi:uncharacterized membrane protein